MEVKVYLVEEETRCTCGSVSRKIVGIRLTHVAAREIAKEAPNRRVVRWVATKDEELTPFDIGKERDL